MTAYGMRGPTARARLDGNVHGVVVQTAIFSAAAPGSVFNWNQTVSAGSCRSRYTSSIRVSVLDSGVSQRQQYASTRKPSYIRPFSCSVLKADMTLSI